jgi:transcriptional regulator with XRE-family HTH domain
MPYDRKIRPIGEFQKELGRQIELFRMSKDLRQIDLAEAAGISRPTLSRIESGQGGTVDTLLRLMRALDILDRLCLLIPDASKSPLLTDRDGNISKERVRPAARRGGGQWVWGDQKPDGGTQ